jgi:hypothetical protein
MADNDTSDKLKKATEQASVTPPELRNPTGKGGFGDNPQNRNPGGWRKEVSFSYQYKRFMAMTSKELSEWAQTPSDKRTVVEDLAYARVVAAKKSLADVKEMTDRTEGKAPQSMDITTNGEKIQAATVIDLGALHATDKPETEPSS